MQISQTKEDKKDKEEAKRVKYLNKRLKRRRKYNIRQQSGRCCLDDQDDLIISVAASLDNDILILNRLKQERE